MGLETVPVDSWWEQKQADVRESRTVALNVHYAMGVSISHREWKPTGNK